MKKSSIHSVPLMLRYNEFGRFMVQRSRFSFIETQIALNVLLLISGTI